MRQSRCRGGRSVRRRHTASQSSFRIEARSAGLAARVRVDHARHEPVQRRRERPVPIPEPRLGGGRSCRSQARPGSSPSNGGSAAQELVEEDAEPVDDAALRGGELRELFGRAYRGSRPGASRPRELVAEPEPPEDRARPTGGASRGRRRPRRCRGRQGRSRRPRFSALLERLTDPDRELERPLGRERRRLPEEIRHGGAVDELGDQEEPAILRESHSCTASERAGQLQAVGGRTGGPRKALEPAPIVPADLMEDLTATVRPVATASAR